jgi:hypothetical protein
MPVRYFQGVDDDYYYQIKGKNGEVMCTSEGYSRESDARRGYEDLYDQIIRDAVSLARQERMERASQGDTSNGGDSKRPEGGSESVPESASQADVQSADADGEGTRQASEADGGRPEGFSTHDEVPDDNPDALRRV